MRRRLLLVACAVLLLAGGLFTYRVIWRERSEGICTRGLGTPTKAEREAALKEGRGPLAAIIAPHDSCADLEDELVALERSGTCPKVVLDDVPCTCGEHRWTGKDSPMRCATGLPTTCDFHGEIERKGDSGGRYLSLGCRD